MQKHLSNKKKNERYKAEGRLKRNKTRNILKELVTATGKAKEFLEARLLFWKGNK